MYYVWVIGWLHATENILHTSVGVSENEGWTPQIQMAIFINDV